MPGPYAAVCLNAFHSYLLTPHSFQVLTMPQTPKLSPQQKVALVEKIKAGEISRQAAAQSVGVSNTTVRQWLRIYERGCRRPCTPGKVTPPYRRGKTGRRGGVPRGRGLAV
ncbi:MAG: helix-turn-helix domain-containing protein [Gemmiger formicilis]|uniref:helix-turn-helix domain-containing protein n=1 Tax=Gemmiger formicilis TaxID=745368 RepID=UPI003A34A6BF